MPAIKTNAPAVNVTVFRKTRRQRGRRGAAVSQRLRFGNHRRSFCQLIFGVSNALSTPAVP